MISNVRSCYCCNPPTSHQTKIGSIQRPVQSVHPWGWAATPTGTPPEIVPAFELFWWSCYPQCLPECRLNWPHRRRDPALILLYFLHSVLSDHNLIYIRWSEFTSLVAFIFKRLSVVWIVFDDFTIRCGSWAKHCAGEKKKNHQISLFKYFFLTNLHLYHVFCIWHMVLSVILYPYL